MVLSYHHLILVSYYLLLLSYHSLRKKATKSTQYVKENPTCSALPVLAGVGFLGNPYIPYAFVQLLEKLEVRFYKAIHR